MSAEIATHLNVTEAAILEVQEWARVLWVRVKGIGARFVSKKVVKVNYDYLGEAESSMHTEFKGVAPAFVMKSDDEKTKFFLKNWMYLVRKLKDEAECTIEELNAYALPRWTADNKGYVALEVSGPVAQKVRFHGLQEFFPNA